MSLNRVLLPVLLCVCLTHAFGQPLPALIPYTDGRKWGYADTAGRVVITPQWDEARFFRGSRAEVLVNGDTVARPPAVHCIIDREGHYIVPPGAGWNGIWAGWALTGLNARDHSGLAGMVDTAGRLLLPYAWDFGASEAHGDLADSFKVVFRNGRAGIVCRDGRTVVPPVWRYIFMNGGFQAFRAVEIRDTVDNWGDNRTGLIDMENHILLPPHYHEVRVVTRRDGSLYIRASTQTYNAATRNAEVKWHNLSLVHGRFEPTTDTAGSAADLSYYEIPQPGGYTLFYNGSNSGLMDAARRVVVPCCVAGVTAGTITIVRDTVVSRDSLIRTLSWLSTRTLKPTRPSERIVLYREPVRQRDGYLPHPRRHYAPVPVIPLPGAGAQHWFYKDSMLYVVSGYATSLAGGSLFLVEGGVKSGPEDRRRTGYGAIVDSLLDYVLPPVANFRITGWDAQRRIATAYGYSTHYARDGYTLLDSTGRERVRPQTETLDGGYAWRQRYYARSVTQEREDYPDEDGPLRTTGVTITDSNEHLLPALAPYTVAMPYQYDDLLGRLPDGYIAVTDSAGRIGFVTPEGTVAWPQVSFKYGYLKAAGKEWFLAKPAYDKPGLLLDSSGRPMFHRLPVYDIMPAQTAQQPFNGAAQDRRLDIPRLYQVIVLKGQDRSLSFYLDDKGRAYRGGE